MRESQRQIQRWPVSSVWLMATVCLQTSRRNIEGEENTLQGRGRWLHVGVTYFMQRECRWQRDVGTRTRQEGKASSRVWLVRSSDRDKSWRAWGESSRHLEDRRQGVRSLQREVSVLFFGSHQSVTGSKASSVGTSGLMTSCTDFRTNGHNICRGEFYLCQCRCCTEPELCGGKKMNSQARIPFFLLHHFNTQDFQQ